MNCPLCHTNNNIFFLKQEHHVFYCCKICDAKYRDISNYITAKAEKERYKLHNNDVDDKSYQNFVSPIVNYITANFDSNLSIGIDFGAGTGPVITKLLEEKNYTISVYDPFFHPNKSVLEKKYDYIVCCEVIEHFKSPKKEFVLLKKLLKSKGKIVCMTHLYENSINFKNWYYKNDPTHIFIYTKKTIGWIKENFGFSKLEINNRLIVFDK